jgi:MFS transporter, DHA2 family, multidrug resistance protein
VFLLAVPVMAVLLVLGPRLLPEFRDPHAGRLDLVSAGLSVVAVLAVIYGLKRIAESGFDSSAALTIAAGLAVTLVFVQRQRVLSDPLIDLGLFRSATFNAALAANTLSLAIAFGIFLFIAQYLQLVLGFSPLEAGLWTVPSAGGFITGSMLAPVLVRHVRPWLAVAGGLGLTAVGLVLLAQADGSSGLAVVVVGSVIVALGVAVPVTLGTDLVVGCVAPERAGVASGISETGAELGGALGIAVLGSIGVAVYRNQIALPIGVTSEQAAAAEETLGGALEVVDELGVVRGTNLLDAAEQAFTQGMQVAAVTGAVVALVAAVLAGFFLRGAGIRSSEEPHAETERDAAHEAPAA